MREWSSFDTITKGKGIWLIDEKGNKIIDAVGSMWCNVWGHSNPQLIKAITKQSKQIQHSSLFNLTNEPVEKLAKNLIKMSPGMNKVFYSDNGSSAMEIAIKMALQYWKNIGETKKDTDCNNRKRISRRYIWCNVCRVCSRIFWKI
jgi:adenosylmethionine-8-amino-7-oxononanoate aminotransferase